MLWSDSSNTSGRSLPLLNPVERNQFAQNLAGASKEIHELLPRHCADQFHSDNMSLWGLRRVRHPDDKADKKSAASSTASVSEDDGNPPAAGAEGSEVDGDVDVDVDGEVEDASSRKLDWTASARRCAS